MLFISDPGTGDVNIFTMPALALRGTITGFIDPNGLCSDRSGNVWVTDTLALTIQQYNRAGVLLNTLSDPDGYPGACAVDPTTGNLAVVNLVSLGLDTGSVLIYPGATGPPSEELHNPSQFLYYFAGYDRSGNLYVDGLDFSGDYILSLAGPGSSTMSTVSVSGGTIDFPGMVQWNPASSDLVLGDQYCLDAEGSCLYSASVSGSTATITGTTDLSNFMGDPVCDMAEGALAPLGRLVAAGGDFASCSGTTPSSVSRWLFPAGGTPTNFNDSVVVDPVGAAISANK